ncbi:D-2-hydroxyacid dehydrogenase [Aquamicrobium terrae]|uniref:Phosphoglycerate dehydrogenase-like enzyme n=1 Tax=Aquamicrobium terrae TaxID=1324945 RepID=A0ABV2N7G9_9HYPH
MPALTIVMTGQEIPTLVEEVQAAAPGAQVLHFKSQAEFEAALPEADIAATVLIGPEALARARKLKWVQSWSAGPDHTLTPELIASDVLVTCARGNGAIPLAEHAIMMMLMLDRQMTRSFRAQQERRWDRFFHGELNGRTCGIVGTGFSGIELARKAKAFHMRMIGLRRTAQSTPSFDRIYGQGELKAFLAECDFLIMAAPLTPQTRGMIGAEELAAMKPSAFYVCFSRGGIVDDDALLEALRSGRLAGAGLDAHNVEPLPPDSPFWGLDNVIITPHHGAVTMMSRRRGLDIFLENLKRFQAGQPLLHLVDKETGY